MQVDANLVRPAGDWKGTDKGVAGEGFFAAPIGDGFFTVFINGAAHGVTLAAS